MTGNLHVLGNDESREALIVGRMPPHERDLISLSSHFAQRVREIAAITPDVMMQQVLSEIDAFRAHGDGDNIISNPQKEVQALCIAFTNGWNAYHESQVHTEDYEPRESMKLMEEWLGGDKDASTIEEHSLSAKPAHMLEVASAGIMPPELAEAIVGAIDQLDLGDWEITISEMFKDGWNAARSKIAASSV